jgi:hypothetical protein
MFNKTLVFGFLVFSGTCAIGQISPRSMPTVISVPDQNGKAVARRSVDNVKGSPFLYADWFKGNVKLSSGEQYSDVALMYDQVDDKLMFKQNDNEFEFSVPVVEFTISNGKETKHYRSGFPKVLKNDEQTYYEVLWENPSYSLLKRTAKEIIQTTGYNQVTEKRFDSRIKYFIKKADGLVEVKPNNKSVMAALDAKSADILKSSNIKNEASLIASLEKLN